MNKCLKITIKVGPKEGFIHNVVQKYARKFGLEGLAQPLDDDRVRIIVCGDKEDVDSFIDIIHKESSKDKVEDMEIEPHLKDKDYRGVFRVIE